MDICSECYSDKSRITPILNPRECLENHKQYICGSCGRCICIDKDKKRKLQRWNFPFKSFEVAKLYLRTADFTMKKSCGIYELINSEGRKSYKIFSDIREVESYINKSKDKNFETMNPIYIKKEYKEFSNTKLKYLDLEEKDIRFFEQLNNYFHFVFY